MSIVNTRLDDGIGIERTLKLHNAKWNKSCYASCNKTKVDRVRKKVAKEHSITSASPLKCRLRVTMSCSCFFFDAPLEQDYHKAATLDLDTNVCKMATELKDTTLLAKLSSVDMVAKDAVYHKHCLTGLFTRYRSSIRQKESSVLMINCCARPWHLQNLFLILKK